SGRRSEKGLRELVPAAKMLCGSMHVCGGPRRQGGLGSRKTPVCSSFLHGYLYICSFPRPQGGLGPSPIRFPEDGDGSLPSQLPPLPSSQAARARRSSSLNLFAAFCGRGEGLCVSAPPRRSWAPKRSKSWKPGALARDHGDLPVSRRFPRTKP